MKMNIYRAKELIVPLKNGTAVGVSEQWRERLIEALEYVIEKESFGVDSLDDAGCPVCGCPQIEGIGCPNLLCHKEE